jgi:hypothetical protein
LKIEDWTIVIAKFLAFREQIRFLWYSSLKFVEKPFVDVIYLL